MVGNTEILLNLLPLTIEMVNGRRWVLKNHFNGAPTVNDFELVEEELPELKVALEKYIFCPFPVNF